MKDPNTALQFAYSSTLNTFSKVNCIQNFDYFQFCAIRFKDSNKVQMASIKKVP